jgi:hypothetical protein
MKNKGLIFLFILFIGTLFLSFFITRQSLQVTTQQEEFPAPEQSWSIPADAPRIAPAAQVKLPPVIRGITIIRSPAALSSENTTKLSGDKDKASNTISGVSGGAAGQADVENEQLESAGVTKTKKQPPSQEAREMNSRGIILY